MESASGDANRNGIVGVLSCRRFYNGSYTIQGSTASSHLARDAARIPVRRRSHPAALRLFYGRVADARVLDVVVVPDRGRRRYLPESQLPLEDAALAERADCGACGCSGGRVRAAVRRDLGSKLCLK